MAKKVMNAFQIVTTKSVFFVDNSVEIENRHNLVPWHGCAAHLIQLVVNSELKEGLTYTRFSKLIAKCKKISGLDKWSNQFSQHLSKRFSQLTEGRWNSFFRMITSIIDQIEHIDDALKYMNRTELLIHDSDVKVLKNFSLLLQYFDSCSIHIVIPLCQILEKAMFSIEYSNDPSCNAIKERCLTALEKKFSFIFVSNVHIFATVCDPRKKTGILKK